MQLAIFFLTMLLCLSSLGCGKKGDTETVPNKSQGGGVGPFNMELSPETSDKLNAFSADINQDEGAVDFFVQNGPAMQYLVLDSYTATVSGCNANNVKVTPIWYSSESSTNPTLASAGTTLLTTANTRSKLRIAFQGMGGCTHLDFKMVVRKLEIGVLQPSLQAPLQGSWDYGTSPGLTITLFIGSSRVGWLEGVGVRYTCDTEMYPSDAPELGGGWLVSRSGGLLCHYKFDAFDNSFMTMNCFGTNYYGCTVPKNLRFKRH